MRLISVHLVLLWYSSTVWDGSRASVLGVDCGLGGGNDEGQTNDV